MKADFIQLLVPAVGEDRSAAMADLKKHSIKINYFYAKKPEELETLFKAGVDFVLVNDPASFTDEARKLGVKHVQPEF